MNSALLFAFLSPLIWASVNVFDKYLVSHKVKYPLGYAMLAGFFYLLFGGILALFLDWDAITIEALLWPLLAGGLLGLQLYFYYIVSKKADVSYVLGIYYFYPIIVTFLSFLFLNEVISFIGYIGAGFTILGVLMMSLRAKKMKFKLGLWMIGVMIITGALSEFFVKVSTMNLPILNGLALNNLAMGAVFIPALFLKSLRKQCFSEFKNIKYIFISESITFFAVFTLYLAMVDLPATIVTSLSATQPVFVVLLERIAHWKFGKIIHDDALRFKLGAVVLVVIGVILLTTAA
ncbi:MAG: EamA family transporter [Nanoarchaeota archaeon]